MKQVDVLFTKYGESHQHPTNKVIHWACVPLITFSLLGMLWWVSPYAAYAFIAGAMIFYLWLSIPVALGMAVVALLMMWLLAHTPYVLWVSLAIFVLAWIGQFIGHQIEGKKPSFLEDIKFLLIGPAWLLGFIYRRLRIPY